MNKLKPCPFCGGKAKINARQARFCGKSYDGNVKISWAIYIKCNKCHSRGKPIRTMPIWMYYGEGGSRSVGNFYASKYWGTNGVGLQEANDTFKPYVEEAIEAWNRRVSE